MGLHSPRSVLRFGDQQNIDMLSWIRVQRQSLDLPASLLRFVLVNTGVAEAEITLDMYIQLLKEQNKI